MRKRLLLLLVSLIVLLVIVVLFVNYKNKTSFTATEDSKDVGFQTPTQNITEIDIDKTDTPADSSCSDFYNRTEGQLSLYKLPDFVKNNKDIVDVLEAECLQVYQTVYTDVTGDGEKDILLNTEDLNCVTCRNNRLLIFSNNSLISDTYIANMVVRTINGRNNAFEIKEPILGIALEEACCPSTGLVKVYEFYGEDYSSSDIRGFALKNAHTEKYTTDEYGPSKERVDYID